MIIKKLKNLIRQCVNANHPIVSDHYGIFNELDKKFKQDILENVIEMDEVENEMIKNK